MKRQAPLSGIIALMLLLIANTSLAQQGTTHFDHFKTGFPLTGAHMTVECASCHINGRLQGTPRACVACHNGTLASGMPANHLPTSVSSCDTCHRNSITFAQTSMNHAGIKSGCTSCHNGQTFYGVTPVSKPSSHFPTTADCVTCHKSFATFSGASGMPANHIPTSQPCATCHTGSTYGPNTPMNHAGERLSGMTGRAAGRDAGMVHRRSRKAGKARVAGHAVGGRGDMV